MKREEFPEQPRTKDGRDIDPEAGMLLGEGAAQQVTRNPDREYPTPKTVYSQLPAIDSSQPSPTYYDQPVLKEPVWKGAIPLYFYVGGAAGACGAMSAAIELSGNPQLAGLARKCRWLATGGSMLSAALLIEDLGLPKRFLYMLRVFRPTSPMNVGTWILSTFGASSATSLLLHGAPGVFGRIARTATLASGVSGLGLSSYTAVLLSNTAVPAWQEAHRTLPLLFASSAAASGAALLEMQELNAPEKRIVRTFGVVAKAAELACAELVKKDVSRVPRGARAYENGVAGALWKAAKACTAASLVLSLVSSNRSVRRAAGVLGTAGSLALRLAIFRAGVASARDPRATFEAQRAGFGAADVTKPAVAGSHHGVPVGAVASAP